jgi:hypothetical protein
MSGNRAPERYFYHSFPRRPQTEGHGHGLTILELIRDFGLLMTPEVARWEYSQGNAATGYLLRSKLARCNTQPVDEFLCAKSTTFGVL